MPIDSAQPEAGRELWLPDPRLPGFGVRIWRNRSGAIGRAFGIRATDIAGRKVRETFSRAAMEQTQRFRWAISNGDAISLSDFHDDARFWAEERLAELRGELSPRTRKWIRRQLGAERAKQFSLLFLKSQVEAQLRKEGCSEVYVARLYKLFYRYVPGEIHERTVASLEEADIRRIFFGQPISPGNLRVLRPYIRRMFKHFESFGAHGAVYSESFPKLAPQPIDPMWDENRPDWERAAFERVVAKLTVEQDKWQQWLCLQLYFRSLQAPLSAVMSARWDQFAMHELQGSPIFGNGVRKLCAWQRPEKKRSIFLPWNAWQIVEAAWRK